MKKSIAIVTLLFVGAVGGGVGLGYENSFYMFAPDFRFSPDGGSTWREATAHDITSAFLRGFIKGWVPAALCLPMIALAIRVRLKKRRIFASLLLAGLGAIYGVVGALAFWVVVGGWGPHGLVGLVSSGTFIGIAAPWVFRRERDVEPGGTDNDRAAPGRV